MKFEVTREQQIKELVDRVPPILNVDIVIVRDDKYLIGRRNKEPFVGKWQHPGGRVRFDETLQETALRILQTETPGINARLKNLITATSGSRGDKRANGVTLYYLFEYISGEPKPNINLDEFEWVTKKQFLNKKRISPMRKSIVNEVDTAIRFMNSTEDEILVEVDKNDNEIGTIIKREAHATNKRFHRAAHIMIFDSKGDLILQQRSFRKSSSPGKWDMPGGHQASGQTIEQCANAELSEELGIQAELHFRKKLLTIKEKQSEFRYLYWGINDGPYGFDRNEVEAIRSLDPKKLLEGKYDSEFVILDHVKEYVEELKDIWEPIKNAAKTRNQK